MDDFWRHNGKTRTGHGKRRGGGVAGRFVVVLALGFALAWSGVAGAASVSIGYVMWDSEIASHAVLAAVIEDYLGHDVEHITMDAGPMWAGIAQGEYDLTIAAGLPMTHQHYYEQYWPDVENVGTAMHGTILGFVVPSYVTVDSIDELNDHARQFGGRIVGIDPGSGLMTAAEEAMETYDINLTLVDGSDAAMTAALRSAIRRNEWIVVAGWIPHWKFAEWDLKFLEDPQGVFGGPQRVAKLAKPDLHERLPDVYTLLQRFYWTPDDMAEVMLLILDGAQPMDAARTWIAENEDKVRSWLP